VFRFFQLGRDKGNLHAQRVYSAAIGRYRGGCRCNSHARGNFVRHLIERIAAGDQLAMKALFARHRTPVYRWLLRFVSTRPWLRTC
jgi:hypothetical protein